MTDDARRAEAERYLRMAMEEAETAVRDGNHPYGAVLVDPDGNVAGVDRNRTAEDSDPSSHAELNVIRRVCRERGTLTLEGYRLYTNGAPCTMCATMILRTGIAELWYSAPPDPARTLPTVEELVERSGASVPVVHQGLLAEEAAAQVARHPH